MRQTLATDQAVRYLTGGALSCDQALALLTVAALTDCGRPATFDVLCDVLGEGSWPDGLDALLRSGRLVASGPWPQDGEDLYPSFAVAP